MKLSKFFFVFLISFLSLCAQNGVSYPGSIWGGLGNTSPIENGNILGGMYVEQGMAFKAGTNLTFVPYASFSGSFDTYHNDWNNRGAGVLGAKFVKIFSNGIISLGGGYSAECREGGMRKEAPQLQATYWFGWQSGKQFPGSSWGSFGTTSPVERNNVISTIYLQQGIVVGTIHTTLVVPFFEGTLSHDSDRYDWNNRVIYGAGVKLLVPRSSGMLEVGTMYEKERRFRSGIEENSLSLFSRFWFGWNLKH